jgi:hypothetical protein
MALEYHDFIWLNFKAQQVNRTKASAGFENLLYIIGRQLDTSYLQ